MAFDPTQPYDEIEEEISPMHPSSTSSGMQLKRVTVGADGALKPTFEAPDRIKPAATPFPDDGKVYEVDGVPSIRRNGKLEALTTAEATAYSAAKPKQIKENNPYIPSGTLTKDQEKEWSDFLKKDPEVAARTADLTLDALDRDIQNTAIQAPFVGGAINSVTASGGKFDSDLSRAVLAAKQLQKGPQTDKDEATIRAGFPATSKWKETNQEILKQERVNTDLNSIYGRFMKSWRQKGGDRNSGELLFNEYILENKHGQQDESGNFITSRTKGFPAPMKWIEKKATGYQPEDNTEPTLKPQIQPSISVQGGIDNDAVVATKQLQKGPQTVNDYATSSSTPRRVTYKGNTFEATGDPAKPWKLVE